MGEQQFDYVLQIRLNNQQSNEMRQKQTKHSQKFINIAKQ